MFLIFMEESGATANTLNDEGVENARDAFATTTIISRVVGHVENKKKRIGRHLETMTRRTEEYRART